MTDMTGNNGVLKVVRENGWDLARLEREYILDVLESCRGHRARASEVLGIDRRTLYRKLKEYGAPVVSSAGPAESR